PYLGKIVGFLADNDYLETRKGPAGGVSLAEEPGKIKMDNLMEDIEEFQHSRDLDDTCCLAKEFESCFIENTIDRIRDSVLNGVTLEDAVEEIS
ncbi:MAG: Rrf2 family transcriptional regulator, partial [bacterium]